MSKSIKSVSSQIHPASYKDPDGFIFTRGKTLYRQINYSYKKSYEQCKKSGLFDLLFKNNLLLHHVESNIPPATHEGWKIIKPEQIPFISHPYEWSFSMYKDAALLTLAIQKTALNHNMILKDASAFNIQFLRGKPIFIDTLSFEPLRETLPWTAYRQFCMQFLSPLLLASHVDIHLLQMLRDNLDGIPIDLTHKLLPFWTTFHPSIALHIHAHANKEANIIKTKEKRIDALRGGFSKLSHYGMIDSLTSLIISTTWKLPPSRWGYYDELTSYSVRSYENKKKIIEQLISVIKPHALWDIGANTGTFTRLAMRHAKQVISFDIDPVAIERNYLLTKQNCEQNILPLFLDISNPSPSIGWNNSERISWKDRGPSHTTLVLALIHHLCITYNLSFSLVSSLLSEITKNLIIEFVPKNDPQTISLLQLRKDIFPWYSEDFFEKEFSKYFRIKKRIPIKGSKRVIYWMRSKQQ